MGTSSDQWLERLQRLARELRAEPSAAGHAVQLQKLLDDWQNGREALDQDFIIQLSFFLGTLSGQVQDANIRALIQELMQSRGASHTPASASGSRIQQTNTPRRPTMRRPVIPRSGSDRRAVTDEEYIDFDNPDEPREPERPVVERPPAPPRPVDPPKQPIDSGEQDDEQEGPGYPEVERRVNSAYRLHLDRKHGEIEKLQELLAQKASEALTQNKEFGAMLQTERAALEQASSVEEINEMKQILIGSADELLSGQRDMEEKLRSSFEYLQVIKNDSERLHNELNKVRLLSMTDENTGLPNRRAFLRRLEDDIQRAKQYGIPLTLALIDLDFFKEINDQYGHPAGDAVLNWYAQEGLPIFRHYDMVARYGGEEFAVVFPGTTADGANLAMGKLRAHVAGKSVDYEGQGIGIPTFSAGLAAYREGEDDASLIKRADQALYRAKSQGRNCTVLEQRLPPTETAGGREP